MSDSHSEHSADADQGHFVQLLAKHEPEIRAFIRASLPSSHDVAEVMQNVSLIAWKKFAELEDADTGFARWVCVIARFEIMKFRRSLARGRFVLDEDLTGLLCEELARPVLHTTWIMVLRPKTGTGVRRTGIQFFIGQGRLFSLLMVSRENRPPRRERKNV